MNYRSRSTNKERSSISESEDEIEILRLRNKKAIYRNPLQAFGAFVTKNQKFRSKSLESPKTYTPFKKPSEATMAEGGDLMKHGLHRSAENLSQQSEISDDERATDAFESRKQAVIDEEMRANARRRDEEARRTELLLTEYEKYVQREEANINEDRAGECNRERLGATAPPQARLSEPMVDRPLGHQRGFAPPRDYRLEPPMYGPEVSTPVHAVTPLKPVSRISDSVIAPQPFFGKSDDGIDAEEWLIYFLRYAEHKGWDKNATKGAFELMMRGNALHWLIGLNDETKRSMDSLMEAFKTTFLKSPELRWVEAQQMFTKPQTLIENVSSYVIRLRRIASRVNADSETIRHAFIAGLRPELRMQVLLKGAKTFEEAIHIARLAEAAGTGDSLTALLEEQIRSSTKSADKQSAELRELTSRVNILANAVLDPHIVSSMGNKEQQAARDTSPQHDRVVTNYAPARPLKDTPQNRQRVNYGRMAAAQGRQSRQGSLQSSSRGQRQGPWPQQQQPMNQNFRGQACPNCGRQHNNECYAKGQTCRNCGKIGHYARCCRSGRGPPQQNN